MSDQIRALPERTKFEANFPFQTIAPKLNATGITELSIGLIAQL